MDETKLPEEWAEELGLVMIVPRDGRKAFTPEYRAADALHQWSIDTYEATAERRLRITRSVFDAALAAPKKLGPRMREPAPVLEALGEYAPQQVRDLALKAKETVE